MQTATAIYHAPEGDAKSCTMNGVTFNDGEEVELNSNEHGHVMSKLPTNPHFEVKIGDDDGEASKGASSRDFKAGIENARDHDFEAEQRAAQAERDERALAATPRRGRPPKAAAEAKEPEPKEEPKAQLAPVDFAAEPAAEPKAQPDDKPATAG